MRGGAEPDFLPIPAEARPPSIPPSLSSSRRSSRHASRHYDVVPTV
jgi:hypothetical protein